MPSEIWTEITAKDGRKTFYGYYRKIGQRITVRTPLGMKTAQLIGLTPEYLAKMLLRGLAREGRA